MFHLSNAHIFLFTDIAVATTNEIDLFSSSGKVTGKLQKPTSDLQSLAFDPVHEVFFFSDETNSNYSIFSLSLQGDQGLKPFIKSKYFIVIISS
jgi:hypothetical protein